MAQDEPPNPQHRVGTIGGRASQHHDASSSRVSSQQQHPAGGQQPYDQAAHRPKAATHRGAPASRPLGSAATPHVQKPPAPAPPAPRAVAAQPRAGASGWSRHRRRGATNRRCASRSRIRRHRGRRSRCPQRGRSPSGVNPAPSGVHNGAVPARSPTGAAGSTAARPGPQTSADPASGGTARTSR